MGLLIMISCWATSLVVAFALGALSTHRHAQRLITRQLDAEMTKLRRETDEMFESLRKQAGLS